MNCTTNEPLRRVLNELDGVKQTGATQWVALCPSHSDRKPSLSISIGDSGKVLIHCQAGCETDEILAELDLTMADLFPHKSSKIVATYDYRDTDGTLLYQT